MLVDEVLKCSFSNWYPLFSHVTIESDIIKLDSQIRDYLLEDGVILPRSCFIEMDSDFTDDEVDQELPNFPELEHNILQSIARHGHIFPKLNWSAPDDASWIQALGTKCSNLSEVFLLLKSSDKIVHDLTEVFQFCTDYSADNPPPIEYCLVLRKWQNINPSMEFRVFVAKNEIIGISQRDVRSFYEHIDRQQDDIISDILNFFNTQILNHFPLENFIMDIYRPASEEITLIDINPFGPMTDSLLYDWDELRSKMNAPSPPVFKDFRFIDQPIGVQTQRLEMNSLPMDVFNGNLMNSSELFASGRFETQQNGDAHTNGHGEQNGHSSSSSSSD